MNASLHFNCFWVVEFFSFSLHSHTIKLYFLHVAYLRVTAELNLLISTSKKFQFFSRIFDKCVRNETEALNIFQSLTLMMMVHRNWTGFSSEKGQVHP